MNGFSAEAMNHWRPAIKQFFEEYPELQNEPTLAYFGFLRWGGWLSADAYGQVLQLYRSGKFPAPETFVRVRRDMILLREMPPMPASPQGNLPGFEGVTIFHAKEQSTREYFRDGNT